MTDSNVGLLISLIGVLIMVGTALNWHIVTHSGKILNRIFGDTVARVIYMIVGIALFVLGVGQMLGLNWFGG